MSSDNLVLSNAGTIAGADSSFTRDGLWAGPGGDVPAGGLLPSERAVRSKIFSNNCAEVNSLLAEARSLAEPVCMQRGDLTPGASWERSCAISSAGKHVAGVGKHHDNNRGLLLCLFPEMYFHSLRCIHAGWSLHTRFHCRVPLTRTAEIGRLAWSFWFYFIFVENASDLLIAALHVGDLPGLKSSCRRGDGTIPKSKSVNVIRRGSGEPPLLRLTEVQK